MTRSKAIRAIEKAGMLLVFPIKNEREPPSLWHALYPRSEMRWDWGDTADDRVVDLWHLRTELSESREVVYTKWFRGRATVISRSLFVALMAKLGTVKEGVAGGARPIGSEAAALLDLLREDSPQTPRMLRAALGLEGRPYESAFNRAARELWEKLLIVGFGEVDEGSYPALAIGATRAIFEDLWEEAAVIDPAEAAQLVAEKLPPDSAFGKHLQRLSRRFEAKASPAR